MYKGFNLETVEYKGINFTVWDIGGQEKVSSIFISSFTHLSETGLVHTKTGP